MFLNTPIANSADLAGDPAVIARAEAIRSDVATAAGDIETTRRLIGYQPQDNVWDHVG